jgi:hypothetical protein
MLPEGADFINSTREYKLDTHDREFRIEEFLYDLIDHPVVDTRVCFVSAGFELIVSYNGHIDFIE